MSKFFGTDGIRGISNKEPITSKTALKIGVALGYLLKNRKNPKVVIGKDTRLSGYMLESAVSSGLTSMGCNVILLGIAPTPAVSYLTRKYRADFGIVISASHNPYRDNGIKVFDSKGFKLSDKRELKIEKLMLNETLFSKLAEADKIGEIAIDRNACEEYASFVGNSVFKNVSLKGMNIVIDCANGATYKAAPNVFKKLGAKLTILNNEPNGRNINLNSGALHPEKLSRTVKSKKADVGFAYDGDGDRIIAVDEKGKVISGDTILAILAGFLKKNGYLRKNTVVSTVMSNVGFSKAMKELSIKHLTSKVGDRQVLELMRKAGAVLGGEDSGHIIVLDKHTTGDGLLSSLMLTYIIKKSKTRVSELAKVMTVFPQSLVNVNVKSKPEISKIPEISKAINNAENILSSSGRVLVRYSGTQSICRVMVEGPSNKTTSFLAKDIAGTIKKCIG